MTIEQTTDTAGVATPYGVRGALEVLRAAIDSDPEYAWTWHCNIVEANMQGGYLKWKEANEAACRVMKSLFDVDTSAKFVQLLKTRAPKGTSNV